MAIRVRPLNQKETNSGDWDIIRVQDNLIVQHTTLPDHSWPHRQIVRKLKQEDARSLPQVQGTALRFRQDLPQPDLRRNLRVSSKAAHQNGAFREERDCVCVWSDWDGQDLHDAGKPISIWIKVYIIISSVLAIANVFDLIEIDLEFDYSVLITYVEIYNEMIRDLLVPTSGYLELRDDSDKGNPVISKASRLLESQSSGQNPQSRSWISWLQETRGEQRRQPMPT